MRKLISIIIIVVIALVITGCKESDSIKFKKEYESLNNQNVDNSNYKYLSLSIPKDNRVIYKSDEEIIDIIKNETAVVYFGFNSCPWCRSMVESLLKVTNDLEIDKLYYVDISDIRDTLEVDENGNIVRTKTATASYNELLTILDKYLDYYVIYNNQNEEIETKEKRIYAPNVLVVENGKIVGLTTGVSDNLENPFDTIDDKIKEDSYEVLYNLIKEIKPTNVCIDGGC